MFLNLPVFMRLSCAACEVTTLSIKTKNEVKRVYHNESERKMKCLKLLVLN